MPLKKIAEEKVTPAANGCFMSFQLLHKIGTLWLEHLTNICQQVDAHAFNLLSLLVQSKKSQSFQYTIHSVVASLSWEMDSGTVPCIGFLQETRGGVITQFSNRSYITHTHTHTHAPVEPITWPRPNCPNSWRCQKTPHLAMIKENKPPGSAPFIHIYTKDECVLSGPMSFPFSQVLWKSNQSFLHNLANTRVKTKSSWRRQHCHEWTRPRHKATNTCSCRQTKHSGTILHKCFCCHNQPQNAPHQPTWSQQYTVTHRPQQASLLISRFKYETKQPLSSRL